MGGTLPAMARFAVSDEDGSRRGLALLYGMNTLGAVAGAASGTFFLFERFGNHTTLYLACVLNAGVAGLAWFMSRGEALPESLRPTLRTRCHRKRQPRLCLWFSLASAVTGFVFLLMELVWYRMLSPIFGGTAFTFGLILAVALLGIGIGGVMYSLAGREAPPHPERFRLHLRAGSAFRDHPVRARRPAGGPGHAPSTARDSRILRKRSGLVCPVQHYRSSRRPSLQAFSFPCCLGSLVGVATESGPKPEPPTRGIPPERLPVRSPAALDSSLFSPRRAPGSLSPSCSSSALSWPRSLERRGLGKPLRALPSVLIGTVVVLTWVFSTGPTAAWRHSQLSLLKTQDRTPNETRDLLQSLRRDILWQADGVETSIGISKSQSLAFIVNGKSDGNAKRDAGTQVMSGLLAALMHPNPKSGAVIGLGTGSTAGWMAAIPSMERVDVVELEPVLIKFAAQCAPVNHDALANPKLNLIIGDGREFLLTGKQRYDLVVSEPSNPYRAGIASLFTREYYEAIAQKLNRGGLFAQWMQAYDMDLRTIQIFYATVSSVFPQIETWQTQSGDLLLIASKDPIRYDLDSLRTRIALEPFQSALAKVWRTTDLEGVFSHYVGNGEFARKVMHRPGVPLNTDDQMLLEFAFARNRQTGHHLSFDDMRRDAQSLGADRPVARGELDWKKVEEQRNGMFLAYDHPPQPHGSMSAEQLILVRALNNYANDNLAGAWENWKLLKRQPRNPIELTMVAECLADQGDDAALGYHRPIAVSGPDRSGGNPCSSALGGKIGWKRRWQRWETLIASLRVDPWPMQALITRTINLAVDMVEADKTGASGTAIYDALQKPFAVYNSEEVRMFALMRVGISLDRGLTGEHVLRSLEAAEPHTPWNWGFLKIRSACYTAFQHPLAADAQSDVVDLPDGGARRSRKPELGA